MSGRAAGPSGARGTLRPQTAWIVAALAVAGVVGFAWAQLGGRGGGAADVRVVAEYPHDPQAFTQGLAIHDGRLYEGTGQYGRSTIRRVDLESGRVEQSSALSDAYFGEGIAILDGKLYQLTWRSGIGIVYDVETFEFLGTFSYAGEGWGLTHDGEQLIMSDGSATIRFLDPETFAVTRRISVRDGGEPVGRLNELEYVDGEIWSNVWYDDRIARIDPDSGEIVGWLDLGAIYPQTERSSEAVLNGIAYDADADRLFVTGKNWPRLYEIEVARR